MAKREELKVGQEVLVNGKTMYVQELNEGTCAGLSFKRKPKRFCTYGILYSVITNPPTVK